MEVPVNLLVRGKVLTGILNIPDKQPEIPVVVIMCYGFNGDRVEQHRMSVKIGRQAQEIGITFVRFDFRNQGLSEGSFDNFLFSEKEEDINEIIEFIKACFRRDDIRFFLIGFSNGCKVTIDTIFNNSEAIAGIVLWNPILQELTDEHNDAGDSRRLYKHPITEKPYKKFYSLRLNLKLLHELNQDSSMTRLKTIKKPILLVLSRDDVSISNFTEVFEESADLQKIAEILYIENTDHLFGDTYSENRVIAKTLEWVCQQAQIVL